MLLEAGLLQEYQAWCRKALPLEQLEHLVARTPGAVDVLRAPLSGQTYLEVHMDHAAMPRFGVSSEDLNELIETAVGGQVVVRDNPALTRLVLPSLGSVNGGRSVRYGAPSVTITGNTALADLGGLLRAAACLDPAATPILVEAYPGGGAKQEGGGEGGGLAGGYKCTFTRWAQVCQYALMERGRGVEPGSHWVADGVCVRAGAA